MTKKIRNALPKLMHIVSFSKPKRNCITKFYHMILITLTICDPSSSSSGLLFSLKQNLAVFSQSRSLILLSAKHSHNFSKQKSHINR